LAATLGGDDNARGPETPPFDCELHVPGAAHPREPYTQIKAPLIPALRLRGRWLAQAGFGIGARIEVMVRAGELVLKVLSPESGI
jgi:hypothetical protein